MAAIINRGSRRRLRDAAAWLMVTLAAAACVAPGVGVGGDTLDASAIPEQALSRFGEFEFVDFEALGPVGARVDSAAALDGARAADFGRPGTPEVSLVRYRGSGSDLLPLPDGVVIWVFHWGNLAEQHYKAFPREDGQPNETVFVRTDYFLFVDAVGGQVIASVSF